MIQLAWLWLRYQPDSKHSRWFQERFGGGSKCQRRIGIVALTRRLLIDLWRFVETGGGAGRGAVKGRRCLSAERLRQLTGIGASRPGHCAIE